MAPSKPTKTMLQSLSHRSDVQRTLILSRSTGAVIESSGYETSSQTSSTSHDQAEDTSLSANDGTSAPAARRRDEQSRISRDAGLVFAHVNATAEVVKKLSGGGGLRKSDDDDYDDDYDDKDTETENGNGDDEMKLCRIRTKRFEYMIVPGTLGFFCSDMLSEREVRDSGC